jgi:CII-binding regulator of phage lambda lysogenization HflD
VANSLDDWLIKPLLRNAAIAVAKAYRYIKRIDVTPIEKLKAPRRIRVNNKLIGLYAGEAKAVMTGRFINVLEVYDARIFPYKNAEKINAEVTKCIADSIHKLGSKGTIIECCKRMAGSLFEQEPKETIEEYCRQMTDLIYKLDGKINYEGDVEEYSKKTRYSIYLTEFEKNMKERSESFNAPSDRVYQLIDLIDYIQTLLHEYTHWYMLAGTKIGILISQLSWRERIDVIGFTGLIYDKINLGKIVGEQFAKKDKADIIGERLNEGEAKKVLADVNKLLDELAKDRKAIKYFSSILSDFNHLYEISGIVSVFIEPSTWALVENETYFYRNVDKYFTDDDLKNYAERVYERSKNLGDYEKVVNSVKSALQIDLTQYSNKDLNDILNDMFKKFEKGNSNLDVPFSNVPLISILMDLIRYCSNNPLEKEKIDIITSAMMRDKETLKYVLKIMSRYKGELNRHGLPSVCSDLVYEGRLIGGCFNPDVGITGDKPVKRPFGSLEEIVGNLALSLKPALILAYLYSLDDKTDYKRAVQKIAERLKYLGIDDFTKIAIDEIEDLKIQLNKEIFYNTTIEKCLNNDDKVICEKIGEFLKEFLRYWIYIVLRLGRVQEMLPNRHGIFLF